MSRPITNPVYKRAYSAFWQLRWTDSSGKAIKRSSGTEDYAEACRLLKIWKDGFGLTVDEVVQKFFERRAMKPKTASGYKDSYKVLRPLIGSVPMGQVTIEDIQSFIDDRRAHVKVNTVRTDLAFLSSLFSFAMTLPGGPRTNPVRDLDRESLKQPEPRNRRLSVDEERRLMEMISVPSQRLIVRIAVEAGLKKEEILSLRVRSINFGKRHVSLIEHSRNVSWERHVPLTDLLHAALVEHCKTLSPDAFVVSQPNGTRYAGVKPWWEIALAKAGILDFHFQDLRHTYACRYVERGGCYEDLQAIFGYSSLQQVQRYACLVPEGTDPIPRYLSEASEIMVCAVPSGGE